MEDGEESVAAAAVEAALGLNPKLFVNEVHGTIADISAEAFEYCLRAAAAPGSIGAAKAAEKATYLQRGLNAIHHVIKDRLDKRMVNWEKFCLWHCFDVPDGFVAAEDDNSCAKESHKDGTSDLDLELDSLRRKLEIANKESENLEREMLSLEWQTMHKRKLDSSVSEIEKLFEGKFVQEIEEGVIDNSGQRYVLETVILQNAKYLHTANWKEFYIVGKRRHCSFLLRCVSISEKAGLVKAIPVLQQKIIDMNKKRTVCKLRHGQYERQLATNDL